MALPQEMNYSQHIDSLGIEKVRVGLAPNNGSEHQCNTGYLNFEVPCQQFSKFADFTNAYIAFDLENTDTTPNSLHGQLGTIALQNKLTVETTSNRKFSEVDNVNALWDIKLSQSVHPDWYTSNGAMMFGTGKKPFSDGVSITNGAANARRYIMPVGMSGLCDGTYVPLVGRENLRFRIDLEQASTAMIVSADGIADSEIKLKNVVLYYDVMTLSDEQMKSVLNSFGGKFVISGTDYYHQNEQIALASTAVNSSIGCSRRKAKKLIGCLRTVTVMTDDEKNSFSRNKAGITEVTVKFNGVKVGQTDLPLNANTSPEAYAESMKASQGGLLNLHSTSLGTLETLVLAEGAPTYTYTDVFNLAEGTADSDAQVGRFYFEVDLEKGFDSEHSVGGLNVMTGNFNLELTKTASTANQYLDIWVEYASEYVLDMQAGGTWQIYN